jgi:uncharacterized lipoprotein YmbA
MRYLPAIFLSASVLFGCASAPANRYYTLSVNPGRPAAETSAHPTDRRTVTLREVSIPDMLNRPQIVLITGPNTVQMMEFDRWAEPLEGLVGRTLAADLSSRLGPDRLVPLGVPAELRLDASITRFEANANGSVTLAGSWTRRIKGEADDTIAVHSFALEDQASGSDLTAIAGAMSRLLGRLADQMAGGA